MFGWLKDKVTNKLTQSNVNRYKREMEAFLLFLEAEKDTAHMVYLAAKGAREFMAIYDCDLYTPFSSIEKYPGLDMALFEQREKARRRGDQQAEKAVNCRG